jgi:tRNA(adenine34) deaminase
MEDETISMNDAYYMKKALDLAGQALARGEFPVGCVLVYENEIVASGQRTHSTGSAPNETDHAEINALRQFSRHTTRLNAEKVALYCTLEPCLMCFGAILINGIGKIVYAFEDAMGGATRMDLSSLPPFYRDQRIKITPHVLRKESLGLFAAYFQNPENAYWKDSPLARYTLQQFDLTCRSE